MAKFDFVECAAKAYEYCWRNRAIIAQRSGLVLGLKFVSLAIIITLGLEGNLLRSGLVLIPAYFIEGMVISSIIIMAVRSEEDAGYRVPEDNFHSVKRNVQSGAIIYVLIKLALSVAFGAPQAMISQETAEIVANGGAAPSSGIDAFFLALILLVFSIWAFRFLWVYVPIALGFTVQDFLHKIRAFLSSIYMMAVWLMCFIPPGLVLLLVLGLVSGLFPDSGEGVSTLSKFVLGIVQVVFDYVMVLLSSIGMGYAVASIFNKEDKNVSLL